ncbi:MAG: hypothetical protein RR424_08920 [Oscillospiraceae bacterium]
MLKLPAPLTPTLLNIEKFYGADLTDAPANVALGFSPDCPNILRETTGKVRKWIGYHTVKKYEGRINGVHFYYGTTTVRLIHAGTSLYNGDTLVYSGMADERSVSRQVTRKLCIFDGKKALVCEGDSAISVRTIESVAKVPTVIIGNKPNGGGTMLEPINYLQAKRTETFNGTSGDRIYQLSANSLDATAVQVKKLNASGNFDELTEGTEFAVDRKIGTVTFNTAPGVSPSVGVPNVHITYSKTVDGYADKINKCNVATVYGVNAAQDRIFVAGNPKSPNHDYYCEYNDPTYWGDQYYSVLGQDNSRIMGYSLIGDKLAAHKDRSDDDTNIVLRQGKLVDNRAAFPLAGSYQGTGAVSKYAFNVLMTEPVFLTKDGIFAVTPSDVLGERYAQNRSYYLDGALTNEANLDEAVSCTYDQFYMLAVNGRIYALDGTQIKAEKNTPYSTRQYVGYYRENVNARVLWEQSGTLCFGDSEGNICEFYKDYNDIQQFNDNGRPIKAHWDTPEFYGKAFYNRKDFRRIAVLLGSALATGCRIWATHDGEKELIKDYDGTARYFSYSNIVYSKFSYKTDRTPQNIEEKIKIKKIKKIQFRLENEVLNEPFALYSATAEFTEGK